jgi:hypothetical protein
MDTEQYRHNKVGGFRWGLIPVVMQLMSMLFTLLLICGVIYGVYYVFNLDLPDFLGGGDDK